MTVPPIAVFTGIQATLPADLRSVWPLAIFGLPYARRVRVLAREGHAPVPGWRQACFYAGLLLIALALTAFGGADRGLLFVGMIEHLLLDDVAGLLIVLGLTGPLISPILRVELLRSASSSACACWPTR